MDDVSDSEQEQWLSHWRAFSSSLVSTMPWMHRPSCKSLFFKDVAYPPNQLIHTPREKLHRHPNMATAYFAFPVIQTVVSESILANFYSTTVHFIAVKMLNIVILSHLRLCKPSWAWILIFFNFWVKTKNEGLMKTFVLTKPYKYTNLRACTLHFSLQHAKGHFI